MTDLDERVRWWTYAQQRLGRAAPDAASALRDVVGVYSSHPSAPLSLHARCLHLDAPAFHALDAVRLPAMRGSIHLLPRATAHLAFRALPEPPARAARRLQTFGLSDERFRELRSLLLAAAAEPRTARELRELTGLDEPLQGAIGALTREGALVRVGAPGLRSNELRYVTASVPQADAEEALAWLAGEYLRAFGPARPADFAWWAGVPARRAARALGTVETEDVGGGLLLPLAARAGFDRQAPRRDVVDLLPKWDALTMGYPAGGRGRFAHADIAERLYDFRGDGLPVLLVDGQAAGTWSIRPGRRVALAIEPFEPLGPAVRRAVDRASEDVVRFLAGEAPG